MKKRILQIVTLLFLVILISTNVYAQDTVSHENGLARKELSKERYENYIKEFDLQVTSGTLEEYLKYPIYSFDVSESGYIAIGFDNEIVLVCDSEMNVLKVISYKDLEGFSYVNWRHDVLEIIFYRSNLTFQLNQDNQICDIFFYVWDNDATREFLHDVSRRTSVEVENQTYQVKKSTGKMKLAGGSYYDQLVHINSDGSEEILFASKYSPNRSLFNQVAFSIILFGGMVFLILNGILPPIIYNKIKNRRFKK